MSASVSTVLLQGPNSHMDDVLIFGGSADCVGILGGGARVTRCTLSGGSNGIYIDENSSDSFIADNDIEDSSGHGIEIEGGGTGGLWNVQIHNNVIKRPAGASHGIMVGNPTTGTHVGIIITGNVVHSNSGSHTDGIRIDGANVHDSVVCGNQSIGHTGAKVTDNGTATSQCADSAHTHSTPPAHTIASHSDTTATGTELDTLTDGSDADTLHTHLGSQSFTQPDAGAVPVLTLDQADVDEDYLKIIGTSDTNVDRALVDAADFTTPGTIVGWLKINVQDDQGTNPITDGDYYIPFYTAPTA